MSKKIYVRLEKGRAKFGFAVGIIFCLVGLFVAIPNFGLFVVLWTVFAVFITYVNYWNGFTKNQIDSHVIKIDENNEDITLDTHTGLGSKSYEMEGKKREEDVSSHESAVERLMELNNLYMQALITKEEYNQKKKEILNEL